MTASRLGELDAGIASLKRRANTRTSASPQPALERIQRSVRNVDVAIRDRQQTVDDLSRRVSALRLREGSELRSREGSPFPSSPKSPPVRPARAVSTPNKPAPRSSVIAHGSPPKTLNASDTPERPAAPAPSLEPTAAMRAAAKDDGTRRRTVARTLERASKDKDAKVAPVTLISRATPASTSTSAPKKAPSLVAHASVARGPVMLDAVPVPGSVQLGASQRSLSASQSGLAESKPALGSSTSAPAPVPAAPAAAAAAAPPTPAPAAAPAPPAPSTPAPAPPASGFSGFAGIKLQLSPSTFSTAAPAERAPRSSLRSSNSKSSHSPAAKLSSTPVVPATGNTGTLFGGVVPPKPKEEGHKKPTGFVR
jgi:hypothetical protein